MLLYIYIVKCPAATKKPLRQKPQGRASGDAVVPPWFTAPSRERPWGVPSHSCAVTGAPVATYAGSAVGHATPGPCSANPSAPLFTRQRLSVPDLPAYSSLHRLCIMHFSVICIAVYTLSLFLSTGKNDRENQAAGSGFGTNAQAWRTPAVHIPIFKEKTQKNFHFAPVLDCNRAAKLLS